MYIMCNRIVRCARHICVDLCVRARLLPYFLSGLMYVNAVYVYLNVCICMYMYICTCVCMYECMHAYILRHNGLEA